MLGVFSGHLSHAVRGPPRRHRGADPNVVRALAAVGQSSRQGRDATRNVLTDLMQQDAMTEGLRFALEACKFERRPEGAWWVRIMKFLRLGGDPNVTGGGWTVLTLAVRWNKLDVVNAVLQCGADPNSHTSRDALPDAASRGYEAIVARLLEAKADPNFGGVFDTDPALYSAGVEGHEGIVARLLAAGADPNAKNDFDCTALLGVADTEQEHEGIVARLLAAKADPNAKDRDGNTPLMLAAKRGYEAIVARLLAANADPNVKNNDGMTALMKACVWHVPEGIVTRLLAAGADPNPRNNNGRTALSFAAERRLEAIVTRLLAAGADPKENARGAPGRTPLMWAASQGHANIVALGWIRMPAIRMDGRR